LYITRTFFHYTTIHY